MLLHLKNVLTPTVLRQARALVADADWIDGRRTAGGQAVGVKHNEQLAATSEVAQALQTLVLQALEGHAAFFSAALPRKVFNPLFNRYAAGEGAEGGPHHYGNHVDSAVMHSRRQGERVRTDLSCTLFLADPDEYDGGELVIEDTFGPRRVKLPAGDAVLYPGTSVHRVEPVTRGARVASFFWIESMVRSDEQRRLLHDMDQALMHLRATVGETDPGVVGLTGTYHNLLRLWADT
ncbi:PKHD-type hydroxylase [Sphaerotilus hippei]|uniref:PKHD-type hydroxylase n=1 Tax=Sphaerotilus hippei TaxID=744406 RepID=A0A318H890_9BURK|nr:Fe2+-dependent dioxygenase [Sphaerotilus hippei]PXW96133.1 PKHD-type hydroxylase [Sphaerotilus hippei]